MSKVTINGTDAQNSFTPGSQDFVGVYFANASGSLNDVTVTDIQQPAGSFGDQPGANGDIYAVSCTGGSCPASTGSSSVTLTEVTATNYDKNGITCDGAATSCTVSGSTVTGGGGTAGTPPLSDQAQNGIQGAYGATASITTTTVSGNAYTCNGVENGSCYSASGILGYQDGGLSVTHSTVTANDDGIVPDVDTGAVTISNNTVTDGTDASVGSAQGIEPVEDGSTVPVTISDNTVTGNDGGGIYNYETGSHLTESGNTVKNDSASETICTVAGPPNSGCTTAVVGGGITNYGTTGGTESDNTIENNAAGGVIDTSSTGGTVAPPTPSRTMLPAVCFCRPPPGPLSPTTRCRAVVPPAFWLPAATTRRPVTRCRATLSAARRRPASSWKRPVVSLTGNTVTTGDGGPGFLLVGSSDSSIGTVAESPPAGETGTTIAARSWTVFPVMVRPTVTSSSTPANNVHRRGARRVTGRLVVAAGSQNAGGTIARQRVVGDSGPGSSLKSYCTAGGGFCPKTWCWWGLTVPGGRSLRCR